MNFTLEATHPTVKAVLHEPSDEIENESICNETKEKESEENNLTSILLVIPLKHSNLDDVRGR